MGYRVTGIFIGTDDGNIEYFHSRRRAIRLVKKLLKEQQIVTIEDIGELVR